MATTAPRKRSLPLTAPRRARRGAVSGKLRFLGAVVAILLVSYAITAILEKGAEGADDTPSTNASGIAENILAPLPMQGEADSSSAAQDDSTGGQAVTLENFGPAKQSAGAYTVKAYDASVIRQPSCGQVDLSYFADAAFLGDSLTGLLGLPDQSGRGTHLRLYRRWPGCHCEPQRSQKPHPRAGGSAGCAGRCPAQEAVYPAGH